MSSYYGLLVEMESLMPYTITRELYSFRQLCNCSRHYSVYIHASLCNAKFDVDDEYNSHLISLLLLSSHAFVAYMFVKILVTS